jgi:hypothetical protein
MVNFGGSSLVTWRFVEFSRWFVTLKIDVPMQKKLNFGPISVEYVEFFSLQKFGGCPIVELEK